MEKIFNNLSAFFGFAIKALLFSVILFGLSTLFIIDDTNDKNKVKYLYIEDTITQSYVDKITSTIDKEIKNKQKNFYFVFNSPGGTPAASYNLMKYFDNLNKHTDIKTFAYINDICTSGCYYSISTFDKIYSNPNAIVGSIGVLLPNYNFNKLSNKIGIEDNTIFVGKNKYLNSPLKPKNNEEIQYLKQNLLVPAYNNFKNDILTSRNLNKQNIDKINEQVFEGKIFIANNKNIKGILIDEVIDITSFKNIVLDEVGISYENVEFVQLNPNKTGNIFVDIFGLFNNMINFNNSLIMK